MSRIKFIIAEKSYIIRTGLSKIIHECKNADVIKEINDENKIRKIINKYNPHFLFINIKMLEDPHNDIRKFFNKKNKTKFVAIVGTKRRNEYFRYFNEVIVIDEEKYEISRKILKLISQIPIRNKTENSELTKREREILREITLGKTNKEAADSLCISPHTVITHRKNIANKLGIRTVAGLTIYAILNKIININQ